MMTLFERKKGTALRWDDGARHIVTYGGGLSKGVGYYSSSRGFVNKR